MSRQSAALDRHIRHALSERDLFMWDQMEREYRRVYGGEVNIISLLATLAATALVEWSTLPDASK